MQAKPGDDDDRGPCCSAPQADATHVRRQEVGQSKLENVTQPTLRRYEEREGSDEHNCAELAHILAAGIFGVRAIGSVCMCVFAL